LESVDPEYLATALPSTAIRENAALMPTPRCGANPAVARYIRVSELLLKSKSDKLPVRIQRSARALLSEARGIRRPFKQPIAVFVDQIRQCYPAAWLREFLPHNGKKAVIDNNQIVSIALNKSPNVPPLLLVLAAKTVSAEQAVELVETANV